MGEIIVDLMRRSYNTASPVSTCRAGDYNVARIVTINSRDINFSPIKYPRVFDVSSVAIGNHFSAIRETDLRAVNCLDIFFFR